MDEQVYLSRAIRYAQALDADDFETAKGFLSPECVYQIRGEIYRGPGEIIQSYQEGTKKAKSLFEGVEYDSDVVSADGRKVTELFRDHLTISSTRLSTQFSRESRPRPEFYRSVNL